MEKKDKTTIILRGAIIFLCLSVIFCIGAVIFTTVNRNAMERERLENETRLAEMQMPTPAPTENAIAANGQNMIVPESDNPHPSEGKTVIVLDAGHGKSSGSMTSAEKQAEGYEYSSEHGNWGEWRHYKNGTFGADCHGSGCTLTAPSGGSCWYSMGNGDRDKEPEINLSNALAAKKYLEEMGYEVRMARESNDQNPSMNKRVSYCFPGNDIYREPDAALYVCIHSNTGGGQGTSYIRLEDEYRQSHIPDNYNETSNRAGEIINSKVAAASGLSQNAPIGNEGYLILFNKCPVPIAYLEIGFFDNSSDRATLNSMSDEIGKAIAEGADEYIKSL